jgi:hypothetical protein
MQSRNAHLFVISIDNLLRTPDRTKILVERFRKIDQFNLVGINGIKFQISKSLSKESKSLLEFIVGGGVSESELGCLLSHQIVYEKMIAGNISGAIVLEDDVNLNLEIEELEQVIAECEKSSYEIVNFYSPKGGVIRKFKGKSIGSNIVPGLYAAAYWINLSGARKLRSENYIYGLADWPITISKIKMGTLIKPAFLHYEDNNSIISATLPITAKNRTQIFFRNFRLIFEKRNLSNLLRIIDKINLINAFKSIFVYRVLKRFYRVKYAGTKGLNETVIVE